MVRRISVIVVWVLATMVATAVALAAVGSVAGQVIDSPASPLLEATTTSLVAAAASSTSTSGVPIEIEAVDPISIPTTSSPAVDDTSTSAAPSTTSAPVSTTQAPGGGGTSTTVPPDDGTTTTTVPDDDDDHESSTSTTQAPAASQTATYQLIGGWVRITYGSGSVTLDGAGPNSGFTMSIDSSGPGEVDVDFRNDDHRSEFKAEWEGGELKVDIDEEAEDD